MKPAHSTFNTRLGPAHLPLTRHHRFLRPAAAGFLILRELITLGRVLNQPKRPLVLILGDARVSDKLGNVSECLAPDAHWACRVHWFGAGRLRYWPRHGDSLPRSPTGRWLWNGPMGMVERPPFALGTME